MECFRTRVGVPSETLAEPGRGIFVTPIETSRYLAEAYRDRVETWLDILPKWCHRALPRDRGMVG